MSILVTGSNGQLGRELQELAAGEVNKQFHFFDRQSLDITSRQSVDDVFASRNFDLCINCAAYTAVDQAEEDEANAFAVNEHGAANIATVCRKHNVRLIHISTDFVFDGQTSSPYKEEDSTNPLGVYGKSKLAGEQAVAAVDPGFVIVRTSWLYSSFGKNFLKTIMKLASDRDELGIIFDQVGTPTYARDLAKAVLTIGDRLLETNSFGGIYHFSNEGVASWYDFAYEIVNFVGYSCQVNPIETHQYPTPAKRPAYSVLNKAKVKKVFELQIPNWKSSLKDCIDILTLKEIV